MTSKPIKSGRSIRAISYLNDHICWVDTWAFERLADRIDDALSERVQADAGPASDAGERIESLTRDILSIYHGPFLGDADQPWSFSLRERLRMKFQRTVTVLGRCHESRQAWERAATCYHKGRIPTPWPRRSNSV